MPTNSYGVERFEHLIEKALERHPGIMIYTIAGQRIFNVYGASGGLSLGQICYLFKMGKGSPPMSDLGTGKLKDIGNGWKSYGLEVSPFISKEKFRVELEKAIEELEK